MEAADEIEMQRGLDKALLATLINRIQARLRVLGISEREASRRAAFNLGYVNDLIQGKSKKGPQLPRLQKLAEALACDVEYLIGTQTVPLLGSPEIRAVD